MPDLERIKNQIESSAKRVLAAYGRRFSQEIIETVATVVLSELRRKSKPRLYDDDVEIIRGKLIFNKKKPNTRKTWLQHDCYNKLAGELNQIGFKCKYIYIPTQINRYLAIDPSDELQENIGLAQLLHDDLLQLKIVQNSTIEQEELDYVCSFIAAAGIFGKMLFDQYHRRLFSIKFRDVHFSPVYINIPYENSDAFYRYFLPYPASAYFMRMVLFYQRNYKKLKIAKPYRPDDYVIVPVHFNVNNFPAKFRRWTAAKLKACKNSTSPDITIDSFRNAVKSASIADLTPEHHQANCYPPFVIAVQSGEIQSYSYGNEFHPHFLGITGVEPEHRYTAAHSGKKSERESKSNLRKALAEIRKKRRALLKRPDSLPERRAASDAIMSVVLSFQPPRLEEHDYQNLEVCAKWIDSMLRYEIRSGKKKKAESVDNYIPKVEKLLCELSDEAAFIYTMPRDRLKEAIKRAMKPLQSGSIKRVIKLFCDFVELENGDAFENVNWRDPELRKENMPSLKPLITPAGLKHALSHFYKQFTGRRGGNRKSKRVSDTMKKSAHKAESLEHITQVSYYTGMRIDEIASLKINSVVFDGGIVFCILDSKTKNGVRNIPFERLAPREYIGRFKEYYDKRTTTASSDSYLFTQLSHTILQNGKRRLTEKKWNTSYASHEVARIFKALISQNFVFHNLRDSFASLLLFRIFLLFPGNKLPERPKGLPCYDDNLFSDDSMRRLWGLVFGMKKVMNEGEALFNHALAVIARIMGHGGPRITFKCYIHTTDWLFYILSKHDPKQEISLTSQQRVSFHQVTYTGLPMLLKGKGLKTITVDELLNGQISLIKVFRQKKCRK